MDVEPERAVAEVGEGVRGKFSGPGYGFTVKGYGRHASSVTDPAGWTGTERTAGRRHGSFVAGNPRLRDMGHVGTGESGDPLR